MRSAVARKQKNAELDELVMIQANPTVFLSNVLVETFFNSFEPVSVHLQCS